MSDVQGTYEGEGKVRDEKGRILPGHKPRIQTRVRYKAERDEAEAVLTRALNHPPDGVELLLIEIAAASLVSGRKARARGRDSAEPDRMVVRCIRTLLGNDRGRGYQSRASAREQADTLDSLEVKNTNHGADTEQDEVVSEHSETGPGNGSDRT
jgi:hypothetical protein